MEDKVKELGGYLPLELKKNNHYYNYDETKMIKCNTGLTALYCAIKQIEPSTVILPYFICNTVIDLVKKMDLPITFYHIKSDFSPEDIKCPENSCIILVNYFGLCRNVIMDIVNQFSNVIIDNTQAFFSEPVFEEGVYNIYSCRKFIGVADGAYLIGKHIDSIFLEEDMSYQRADFLFKQYDCGINGAYPDKQNNYKIICEQRRKMSTLTDVMLSSVDYDYIINRRISNFNTLDSLFGEENLLLFKCGRDNNVPYSYPLLLNKDIRQKLIERKIFVPTLWKDLITNNMKNNYEYIYSKYICHLPIDQRYNDEDMLYIFRTIKEICETGD